MMGAKISSITEHPRFGKKSSHASEDDLLAFIRLIHSMDDFELKVYATDWNLFFGPLDAWMNEHDPELWQRLDHHWAYPVAVNYLMQVLELRKANDPCIPIVVLHSVVNFDTVFDLHHLANCEYCAVLYDALVAQRENMLKKTNSTSQAKDLSITDPGAS
ncbi:MAG: hypothetical protein HZC02_00410 [Candidatus Levybacteria bacterium]|nr:hypothetical protein [Candidatus Levybacteria bacterium]